MKIKLAIRVSDEIAKKAKAYAKKHNTTISKIVDDYFNNFTLRDIKKGRKI